MEKVKIMTEAIPKIEVALLCSTFLEAVQAYYKDPGNSAAFERWKAAREPA